MGIKMIQGNGDMYKTLVFVLLMLAMCNSLRGQGRELVYAENKPVGTLDPYTYTPNSVNDRLSTLMFSQLFSLNEESLPIPDMVRDFKLDPDKKNTAILTLKSGMKWEDDSPVTAEDVVFTIELLKNPGTELMSNPLLRDQLNQILSAVYAKPDQLRLTFKLANRGKEWETLLLFPVLPKRVLNNKGPLKRTSSFGSDPVGSGPFYFHRKIGADYIELKRNPTYHGNPASNSLAPETVFMHSVPDDPTRVAKFEAREGGVDLLVEVPWDAISKIKAQSHEFELKAYQSLSYHYLGCNFRNRILRIAEVRQAISYAIDRQAAIGKIFSGKGSPISGPFPPASQYVNLDTPPDQRNINEAKSLLASVGLEDRNGDGKVEFRGEPVKLRLTYQYEEGSEGVTYQQACEFFQGALLEIGIDVQLDPIPSKQKFLDKVFNNHDFDLSFHMWRFTDIWGDASTFFSSADTARSKFNYIGYSNPRVDDLIAQFATAPDPDTRKYIARELHAVLAKEHPYVFLWSLQNHTAYKRKKLGNVTINPFNFFDTITRWRIKPQY
jgi:peptide/nickel transport system substrate-binding protein